MSVSSISSFWDVFLLFVIPVGGGIPGGVLLAKSRGIAWPAMCVCYFLSDVALACVFEPLMHFTVSVSKRSLFFTRFMDAMRKSTTRVISNYGTRLRPHTLIAISFGVDPMTGRVATRVAGHGFIVGWMLAITGDMFFFVLLMVSTLWLSNVFGDGTWATVVILVLMTGLPYLVRKVRERMNTPLRAP